MQKIKVCLSMKQGSVLVYSLIILSAMLFIVTSISVVSITEKKNASSTDASMQSYQTADSGFQLALKEINKGVGLNYTLAQVFPACSGGEVKNVPGAGPANATYSLSFQTATGPATCADLANSVASIKSIGSYKETVRAVEVAVAAAGSVEPGAVIAYAGMSSCPSGWKEADGTGGTPDLRGQFIRGWDHGAGVDPGRGVGTSQGDEFASHTHANGLNPSRQVAGSSLNMGSEAWYIHPMNVGSTGGSETRPKNIALIYCVKQ